MYSSSETTLSLEQVAHRLDNAVITWTVFAGAAVTAYGSSRPLTDVDILVPAAEGAHVVTFRPSNQPVRLNGSLGALAMQIEGGGLRKGAKTETAVEPAWMIGWRPPL
ncbi:MAG: hypothetical protein JW850_05805 [Thermoflexales bacterium]|nr:hypothetical protein [Thermoflexales bacterium]